MMAPTLPSNRRTYPALFCIAAFLTLLYLFRPSRNPAVQGSTPYEQISQHASHTAQPVTDGLESSDLEANHKQCHLTKLSMLYGAHKFSQLEMALESHRQHSDRWGCGFELLSEDMSIRRLFSKQYFLLSTMLRELAKPADQRQKWLMWVDADSILLNPAISPEAFLPPDHMKDIYALVTADQNGLNAGIFYLKVHPNSVDLLTSTVDYPIDHPDEDLGWFGEQAAMANVIKNIESAANYTSTRYSGIVWVPREWFNTYQFESGFEGKPGDLLVHFAGLGETRLTHMANWLDELAVNQEKWEMPLEKTSHKSSIDEFWAEVEANATMTT